MSGNISSWNALKLENIGKRNIIGFNQLYHNVVGVQYMLRKYRILYFIRKMSCYYYENIITTMVT